MGITNDIYIWYQNIDTINTRLKKLQKFDVPNIDKH